MQILRQGFAPSQILIWEDILGNTNIEIGKGANLEIIHKLVTAEGNCTYILLEVLGGGITTFVRLVSSEGSEYRNIYPPFPSVIGQGVLLRVLINTSALLGCSLTVYD